MSGVDNVGGLAGRNNGSITTIYSAATVSATGDDAGGLVGRNGELGSILASYSTGAVSGVNKVGGFAGSNWGAIETSFSTGAVSGSGSEVGGFTGSARDTDDGFDVEGSFADNYYDIETSVVTKGVGDWLRVEGVEGIATVRLRTPMGYTGIYADWNVDVDGDLTADDPWDFGANYNYPALKVDFNGDGAATAAEFGKQRGPGPVGNLAAVLIGDGSVEVSWTAPTETGDGTLSGNYSGRYSIDGGSTWTAIASQSATTYTIASPQAGATYRIEVWAIGQGAAHTRGAPASVTYMLGAVDYDSDDDGLIEVDSLAQVNAIRYDLDGDGAADDTANDASYAAVFLDSAPGMGCPDADHDGDPNTAEQPVCTGYELAADLDFDEDGDGNRNDTWNTGDGWQPIGVFSDDGDATNDAAFTAVFEGNGRTVSNLFISRSGANYVGLFGHASFADVRNLGLEDVDVTAGTTSADWRAGTRPTSAPPT